MATSLSTNSTTFQEIPSTGATLVNNFISNSTNQYSSPVPSIMATSSSTSITTVQKISSALAESLGTSFQQILTSTFTIKPSAILSDTLSTTATPRLLSTSAILPNITTLAISTNNETLLQSTINAIANSTRQIIAELLPATSGIDTKKNTLEFTISQASSSFVTPSILNTSSKNNSLYSAMQTLLDITNQTILSTTQATTNQTYNSQISPNTTLVTAKRTVASTREFKWIDIMLIVSFLLVFVIGVAGNSLVCYFFKANQNRLHGMARMIYYLAIVDLFASIINPALYLYWQVTFNRKWHFGVLGCKILPALAKCSITISCGIILLITIDRCMVISRPFHPRLKDKHLRIALILIVIYSILCETPMMVYSEIHPRYTCLVPNLLIDGFFWPTIAIYISRDVVFLVTFIITVVIIYLELYNKASAKTLKQQNDLTRNKNVMQMLVTLAIVFICLVFPREVLHIVYMMSWRFGNGIPHSDAIRNVNAFFKVLHMCNSICNVFIYAGLHGRFRHKLFRFLYKLVGKQYKGKNIGMNSDSANDSRYPECDKISFDKANSPLMNGADTYNHQGTYRYRGASMNEYSYTSTM